MMVPENLATEYNIVTMVYAFFFLFATFAVYIASCQVQTQL